MKTGQLVLLAGVVVAWRAGIFERLLSGQLLSGIGGSTPTPPTTPGGGGGGTRDCSFIPGERYVAQTADGKFAVVVGGVERGRFASQQCAERMYNYLVCDGPAVNCS